MSQLISCKGTVADLKSHVSKDVDTGGKENKSKVQSNRCVATNDG